MYRNCMTIRRYFDGAEVIWLLEDEAGNVVGFDSKEEAMAERARRYETPKEQRRLLKRLKATRELYWRSFF